MKGIQVLLHSLDGKTIPLSAEKSWIGQKLTSAVIAKWGYGCNSSVRLLCHGKPIADDEKLGDIGIDNGSYIQATFKLHGGGWEEDREKINDALAELNRELEDATKRTQERSEEK